MPPSAVHTSAMEIGRETRRKVEKIELKNHPVLYNTCTVLKLWKITDTTWITAAACLLYCCCVLCSTYRSQALWLMAFSLSIVHRANRRFSSIIPSFLFALAWGAARSIDKIGKGFRFTTTTNSPVSKGCSWRHSAAVAPFRRPMAFVFVAVQCKENFKDVRSVELLKSNVNRSRLEEYSSKIHRTPRMLIASKNRPRVTILCSVLSRGGVWKGSRWMSSASSDVTICGAHI